MSVWFSHSAIQLYCKIFCSTYCAPSGKIISNHKSNDSCHPSVLLRGGGVSWMDWRWCKKNTLKNMKSSTMLDVSLLVFDIHLVYLCAVTTYVWVSCSHGDTNSERSLCIGWNQQAWMKTNVFFHRYTSIYQLVMGQELMVFCGYITQIRKVIIIVLSAFYIQVNNLQCNFKFSFYFILK